MEITLYKKIISKDKNSESIILWKFLDMYGNIFVTETPLDGTEQEAAAIILHSIANNA